MFLMKEKDISFFESLPLNIKSHASFPLSYFLVKPSYLEDSFIHTVESKYYRSAEYECLDFVKPISKVFN